ncbi:hypothetical protein EG329_004204 [Mollisiaceae sp. DMI_Dod_QoI]|nr:hypothetical protein EG329_004204 [Helotiales sp. DMI_Dod_QoI]
MSAIIDSVSRIFNSTATTSTTPLLAGVTVFSTLAVITISRLKFRRAKVKVIKSPAATLLPKLNSAEKATLPYPPDALPGGRDVDSPYGTTRVYEWGPEDGRKVLLLHGITPPCLAVGAIAHGLVERGCRVMLFDGWGRGYSDSPADLEHDERLYSTQILIAITSSPLSWTGGPNGGFSIIGYSLGGGISLCFTSYFPDLVNSMVLIAPTGLIRPSRVGAQRFFTYIFSIVPESLLENFLKKRLQTPMFPKENSEDIVTAEVTGDEPPASQVTPASLKYPDVTVLAATQWNITAHKGFIHSFISNALFAPAAGQQAAWKRVGLQKRNILIVAATQDPIIVPEELKPDVEELLRDSGSKLDWCMIDGAHDLGNTHPEKIAEEICTFWGMGTLD